MIWLNNPIEISAGGMGALNKINCRMRINVTKLGTLL